MHSERRRRALLFVFFFVFVFFANDAKGDDDDGDGEKEISPNDPTLESFFVSPVSSKMERKSDDFDFFSRFFGQTTHAESGCCFLTRPLRRTEEKGRKRYEEDVKNVNTQNTRRVKSRF